jgi:dephospho-CoA kinase
MHSSTIKSEGTSSIYSSPTRITNDGSQSFSALQIGLTGSIGMGKSTMDKQFRRLGFAVFDADEEVHNLYSIGGDAVDPIYALFPDAIENGAVSRKVLTEKILAESGVLQRIESIVHPLVNLKRKEFVETANRRGDFLIVHDIPLLFETQQSKNFDYVVVVTADKELQKKRVLARPGMTVEKFEAILKKQVPDEEKRKHCDFLISTDFDGHAAARAQVAKIVESVILAHPERWNQWKQRQSDPPGNLVCRFVLCNYVNHFLVTDSNVRKMFDMFLFDLDDTLVPVLGQLQAAQAALFEFMETNMPNSLLIVKTSMKQLLFEFVIITMLTC